MGKEQNSGFKLNVGGPSIILLLCVLGLSMFAVLTIRAAYNGLKLARTSRDAVTEYYDADLAMDEAVYRINSAVMSVKETRGTELSDADIEQAVKEISGVENVQNGTVTVSVRVNDSSVIRTCLYYYQTDSLDLDMRVLSRRLVTDDMEGYSGTGFEIEVIELF